MKKKIVTRAFVALILITALAFTIWSIIEYQREMNSHEILAGLGAFFLVIIGTLIVVYELDLFITVYYFLIRPKTIPKTTLNILANLSFLSFFAVGYYVASNSTQLGKYEAVPLYILAGYAFLRIVYLIISFCSNEQSFRDQHKQEKQD